MPVKFRFWFLLSYLITTVTKILGLGCNSTGDFLIMHPYSVMMLMKKLGSIKAFYIFSYYKADIDRKVTGH